MIVFNQNVRSKISDRRFRRVKYKKSLGKKLPCKIRGTQEVGVLVPIANDLDDLILILRGICFLAVINGKEAETEETGLEAERKGKAGKSVMLNLKDTAISYDLLNTLWFLQMILLETFIEVTISFFHYF